MFKSISQFLNCGFSESPTSSRSGSLSDDLSSESNVSLSKMEHRSLDFKLLLDEVKSGQQVSQNTWQDFNWKKGFLENLILRQFLFLIRLLFQVTIHLVAPSRQEKAAWLTDIAQVRLRQKKMYLTAERELSPLISTLSTNFFQLDVFFSLQCMDNVHFNGLFYNTMPNASSSTLPQCVKSDPNLFKDDVDIRFSKTFNTCKVRYRYIFLLLKNVFLYSISFYFLCRFLKFDMPRQKGCFKG